MSTRTATPKQSKNMPCACGSKKKAKHCCMRNAEEVKPEFYSTGAEVVRDKIRDTVDRLADMFPQHRVIDVTDKLTDATYRPLQLANFRKPIIMVAERCPSTEDVFRPRVNCAESDTMVLYHGKYRTFFSDMLDHYFESIVKTIEDDE